MKLSTKVIMAFLLAAVVPFGVIGVASLWNGKSSLEHAEVEKLSALSNVRKIQVESYFNMVRDVMVTFADNGMTRDAMANFKSAFATAYSDMNPTDSEKRDMYAALENYYTSQFGAEYSKQNSGKSANPKDLLKVLKDPNAYTLQYLYIPANSNPLGSKHNLDYSVDKTRWSQFHKKYHPSLRKLLTSFGLYDIFLINPENGRVVYTCFKELDFTSSLEDGAYAQTSLGQAYRKAKTLGPGEFAFEDFKTYLPSYDAPASFIAAPIYDDGKLIGVAAFQLPIDRITQVADRRDGLGKTGISYMIGQDHLLRSDWKLGDKTVTVADHFRDPTAISLKSELSDLALANNHGINTTTGGDGNETLTAYVPVDVLGSRWGLMMEIDTDEAYAPVRSLFYSVLWVAIGILLILPLSAWWFARRLSGPIENVIERLQGSVKNVASAAGELASSSNSLSSNANESAASLEETVSSVEELASMAKQTASHSKEAGKLSDTARDSAQAGSQEVTDLMRDMEEIATSSRKIEEITNIIDDIAFQTNLLALNAAVEAARAGDQGKGFAVVAEAVRGLAQRSASAAKDINSLIKESVEKVNRGVDSANRSGQRLGGILDGVQKVASLTNEIATASQEQSVGISQISEAMTQIDQGTQANAATAEEAAASSQQLNTEVREITTAVDTLKSIVGGMEGAELGPDDKAARLEKMVAADFRKFPGGQAKQGSSKLQNLSKILKRA